MGQQVRGQGSDARSGFWPQQKNRHDAITQQYVQSGAGGSMHTVVLGSPDEAHLRRVAEDLTAAGVAFSAWNEQPENILTALATKPLMKVFTQR